MLSRLIGSLYHESCRRESDQRCLFVNALAAFRKAVPLSQYLEMLKVHCFPSVNSIVGLLM